MATLTNLVLLMCLCPCFTHVIPVHTGDSADVLPQDLGTREHHMVGYHRPMLHAVPIAPPRPVAPSYGSYYNFYMRKPEPQRPRSELFQPPALTGQQSFNAPGGSSSGFSYVNNLLSGVNNKIYSKPGPGSGSSGFGFPTSFGTPTRGSATFGTPAGSTGLGTSGTGFPGGSGGSVTDIFGPGIAPAALDLPDPTSGNRGSSTGPGDGSTGVIINNGPGEPSSPLNPGNSQPVNPAPVDPQHPFMDQQSDTWFWPDDVITGALPSIHLGASSSSSSSSSSFSNDNVLPAAAPPSPPNVVLPAAAVGGSVSVPAFGGFSGGGIRSAPFVPLGNTQDIASRDSLPAQSLQSVADTDPQLVLDQPQRLPEPVAPQQQQQQQQLPVDGTSPGLNNDQSVTVASQGSQQQTGRLSDFLSRDRRV